MPLHSRYVVEVCDNDKRLPDKMFKHSNVQSDTKMHKLLVNNERKTAWIAQVSKGRKGFQPPKKNLFAKIILLMASQVRNIHTQHFFSNNFNKYRPNTKKRKQPFPRSRKMLNVEEPCNSNNFDDTEVVFESNRAEPLIKDKETMTDDCQESVPIRFCQLTRESDVLFSTGLENNRIFQKHYLIIYKRKLLL